MSKASAPMGSPEFPQGFSGDMEALHKHHQQKLSEARRVLLEAKQEVERWEKLEAASGCLAAVAMRDRWERENKEGRDG